MNYLHHLDDYDKYMQEAILFMSERVGETQLQTMTDVEIGYAYGKIYAREGLWKKSNT